MGEKTTQLCVRMSHSTRSAIEGFARQEGITLTEAVESLVQRGLSRGCTQGEVQQVVDAMSQALCDAVREEVRVLSERTEEGVAAAIERADKCSEKLTEALGEVRLAEKQMGNGAQAALANLAFSIWFGKSVVGSIGGRLPEGAIEAADYLGNEVRAKDAYSWFWNVGGALRRDPRPSKFYRAFAQTGNLMAEYDVEKLTGVKSDVWERQVGCNDSEAIASLAQERRPEGQRKRRDKGGWHGKRQ